MESSEEHRHIVGYGRLVVVLALLLILTGVTVAVSYIDLGFLKAALVLLFFMHLRYEGPIIRYSFITTVMFLAIMIGFTFWDVAFR